MIWIHLTVVLAMLWLGARIRGLGMGVTGGLGVVILTVGFGLAPGSPPIDVMLIILAAVAAAAALEGARGLDWLVQQSERLLRRYPRSITFLGPLTTYTMTLAVGTGHTVYVIQPIIADVAVKTGIRPERPLAVASIASQLAITASPLSAAVAWLVAQLEEQGAGITIGQLLAVTIPATLVGVLAAATVSSFLGKPLEEDPEYRRRMADPKLRAEIEDGASLLDEKLPWTAPVAVALFVVGLIMIVLFGIFEDWRPVVDATTGKRAGIGQVVQMFLLATAAAIILVGRVPSGRIIGGAVFRAGMTAVIAIFGIAWLADTFVSHHLGTIRETVEHLVREDPWTFAFAFFAVSIIVNSQAATARMLGPLAFTLGIPPATLIAIFPTVYAYFFIPNYPSDLATIQFDRTGTTRIGKFLFNHSFMVPGMIAVWTSVIAGMGLAKLIL